MTQTDDRHPEFQAPQESRPIHRQNDVTPKLKALRFQLQALKALTEAGIEQVDELSRSLGCDVPGQERPEPPRS